MKLNELLYNPQPAEITAILPTLPKGEFIRRCNYAEDANAVSLKGLKRDELFMGVLVGAVRDRLGRVEIECDGRIQSFAADEVELLQLSGFIHGIFALGAENEASTLKTCAAF